MAYLGRVLVPEPRPGRDSDLMRSDLRSEGHEIKVKAVRGTAQGVCVFLLRHAAAWLRSPGADSCAGCGWFVSARACRACVSIIDSTLISMWTHTHTRHDRNAPCVYMLHLPQSTYQFAINLAAG